MLANVCRQLLALAIKIEMRFVCKSICKKHRDNIASYIDILFEMFNAHSHQSNFSLYLGAFVQFQSSALIIFLQFEQRSQWT
jgi:hypothetical protein